MSQNSSASSSQVTSRAPIRGVPKKCWCGESVVTFTSMTKENPYRRFYRCGIAIQRKKEHHLFTWVDDALLEDIKMTNEDHRRLTEDVEDLRKSLMEQKEFQKQMFENMEDEIMSKLTEKTKKDLALSKENMEQIAREMANSAIKRVFVVMVGVCLLAWLNGWLKFW